RLRLRLSSILSSLPPYPVLPCASLSFLSGYRPHRDLHSFPTRRSSDLLRRGRVGRQARHGHALARQGNDAIEVDLGDGNAAEQRSEEHTSELQSRENLVCRLLLEKKKKRETRSVTAWTPRDAGVTSLLG